MKEVYCYTPEIKEQFKQRVVRGEPAKNKQRPVPSVGKVMTTVIWKM